jgi:hypothetical protein
VPRRRDAASCASRSRRSCSCPDGCIGGISGAGEGHPLPRGSRGSASRACRTRLAWGGSPEPVVEARWFRPTRAGADAPASASLARRDSPPTRTSGA